MNIASLVLEGDSVNDDNMVKFREHINVLVTDKNLNLLEYSYLMEFEKTGGCLTNISWMTDIVNKIDSKKTRKIVREAFPQYFRIRGGKLVMSKQIKSGISKLKSIELTDEQNECARSVIDFIMDKQKHVYGLYGFAGTGKTTTSVELINYLLSNRYINSVVFTAPTNKAVNVIKSKFRPHLRRIFRKIVHRTLAEDFDFENALDRLYIEDVKIDFITIHKLLKFKTDYGADGGMIFTRNNTKKNGSLIDEYEIVIIDECSMIGLDMLDTIFDDVRYTNMKKGDNYKKVPKIIFTGDPAQLPPVNESRSFIFMKDENELTLKEYKNNIEGASVSYMTSDMNEIIDDKRKALIHDITTMNTFLLQNVVRSKIDTVTKVCHEIRRWVNGRVAMPELNRFLNEKGVYFYEYDKGTKKTKSKWFKKCVKCLKDDECSIILTWTNRQSDEYNKRIRQIMFGKKKLKKFLKGDILMLTEFYCLDMDDDKLDSKFYTSDQIKIVDTDRKVFHVNGFEFSSNRSIRTMKGHVGIESKCRQFINFVNTHIKGLKFKYWALCVQKIGDDCKRYHVIRVLDDDDIERYEKYRNELSGFIIDFSRKMISNYKEKQRTIERLIIKPLWKQWHTLIVSPFANVNYGYSISCHKGQGSNFYNVFVDVHDILQNNRESEFKKCVYTATTRAINELYLLV